MNDNNGVIFEESKLRGKRELNIILVIVLLGFLSSTCGAVWYAMAGDATDGLYIYSVVSCGFFIYLILIFVSHKLMANVTVTNNCIMLEYNEKKRVVIEFCELKLLKCTRIGRYRKQKLILKNGKEVKFIIRNATLLNLVLKKIINDTTNIIPPANTSGVGSGDNTVGNNVDTKDKTE